jgi:hypothetical protein
MECATSRGARMPSVDHRKSPFFSPAFLRRFQKMISTERGSATKIEQAIERALRRIAALFATLRR